MRGGKREGAGRKKNDIQTVCYHRRVRPEWVDVLDLVIQRLKENRFSVTLTCSTGFKCENEHNCFKCVNAEFEIKS